MFILNSIYKSIGRIFIMFDEDDDITYDLLIFSYGRGPFCA